MINSNRIKNEIKKCIDAGTDKFIIYPFGENGLKVKEIMQEYFGIIPYLIVDNEFSKYNGEIINFDELKQLYIDNCTVILTAENEELNAYMLSRLSEFVPCTKIINIKALKEHIIKESIPDFNAFKLQNFLPQEAPAPISTNTKIKIRILNFTQSTWNSVYSICKAAQADQEFELKVILGKGACSELMISIMKNERFQYVRINDYQIEEDKPDILILNHPYDIFSDIKDCRRHCRLIIAASMQLIRYTYDWNDFWHMQQKSFGRFYPDYYLFDSLLYNDMRRAGYISDRIIEMGNAKFDGIYKACQNKSYPPEWDKLKQKKVILWMTDHGVHDGGITQEVSFDIYAGSIFRYALDNPEIGIIFRPHSVLISELLKTGLWTEKDIETLKGYCLKSENIVYDDTLTYDNAFSIADGIITDAFCGITCSSLPTLKPICLTYRNKYDKPFHKELEDCCYSARNEKELLEFMDIVRDDRDTMMELRKKALSKCVKHFDGNNGYRIKEFIKKKYKESVS